MLQPSSRRSPSASLLPQFPLSEDASLFSSSPTIEHFLQPLDEDSASSEADSFSTGPNGNPYYENGRHETGRNGTAVVADPDVLDGGQSDRREQVSRLAEPYAEAAATSSDVLIAGSSSSAASPHVGEAQPMLLAAAEEPSNGSPLSVGAGSPLPPHPHSGSLFVPYLVTEIRELRSRQQRRVPWWRRLFG